MGKRNVKCAHCKRVKNIKNIKDMIHFTSHFNGVYTVDVNIYKCKSHFPSVKQ